MDIKARRSAQAVRQAHKALISRFRKSMEDRAKLSILAYMEQNPAWSPEELKIVINAFIRKYSLNNRYAPDVPQAAVKHYAEESTTNGPDLGRVETTSS